MDDYFGLDIGNHTIKVVQLAGQEKNAPELVAFASASTPFGVMNSDNEEHKQKLSSAISEVIKAAGIHSKNAVVALPESSIFSRLCTVPYAEGEKFEEEVYWEAKRYVPGSLKDVEVEPLPIAVREINGQKMIDVLIVAAPNTLIDKYLGIVEKAGFEALAMETEGIATARAVMRVQPQDTVAVILDWGSSTTDLSVANKNGLVYSTSISIGSDTITRAISQTFQLEWRQAEEYKKTYGIETQHFDGKVAQVVKPVVDSILMEVRRAVEYFKGEFSNIPINRVIFVGDASLLPGLLPYSANFLGLEVQIGTPWQAMRMKDQYAAILTKGAPAYAVAVGLALKTDF